MFQVFHIGGLIRLKFERADQAKTAWSLARFFFPSGHEVNNNKWEVTLADGQQELTVAWVDFLDRYRPAGPDMPSTRQFVLDRMKDLEKEIRGLGRKHWLKSLLSRRLISVGLAEHLWRKDHPARAWFLPSLTVDRADLDRNPDEVIKPLLASLESDRLLVQPAVESKEATADPVVLNVHPAAVPGPDQAVAYGIVHENLTRTLDQALMNSRHLLSLDDRCNSPAGVESIILSILGGGLVTYVLDMSAQALPDQLVDVAAGFGERKTPPSVRGRRYRATWSQALPLWSQRELTPSTAWVEIGVDAPEKADKSRLESVISLVAYAFRKTLEERTSPLAPRGAGWMGLIDQAPWSEDLFQRWMSEAAVEEVLRRLDSLAKPPDPAAAPHGREKRKAWDRLLEYIVENRSRCRLENWAVIQRRQAWWDARDREKLQTGLREQARTSVANPGCDQAGSWLDAWLASFAPEKPARDETSLMLDALLKRCAARRDPEEARLLHRAWVECGRDPKAIPAVAGELARSGLVVPEVVRTLESALPEGDDRRSGSESLSQCLRGMEGGDPAPLEAALTVLSQAAAKAGEWKLAPDLRGTVGKLVDEWIRRLDKSQDAEQWKALVQARQNLQRLKLYEE